MPQLDLFEETDVAIGKPEPKTVVRLGRHEKQVKLATKRREAYEKFVEVLNQLEGKDVFIEFDTGSTGAFSLYRLKLGRLHFQKAFSWNEKVPGMIWLRGSPRNSGIRIDTGTLSNVRVQEYGQYTSYLVDFWNGFGEYPINRYHKAGYECLHITRFHGKEENANPV